MICYNCGNKVSIKSTECDYCGEDLIVLRKAYRLSNSYYNRGLSKARVRDLTGAIFMLKKSLEINKRNTDARDLLGLIYFETGEIVAAFSEWIISKHLDTNSKRSESYMEKIQSNPNKLDVLSQSIKKYNVALNLAHQGDDDLAILQLKKVIRLNPSFVKAVQLISLLYLHHGEYEQAYKYLKRIHKVDVSNTTTLKYLKEIEAHETDIVSKSKRQAKQEKRQETNNSQSFAASSYNEEKQSMRWFLSLIAGIVIGVIASVILIVPTVRDNAVSEFRNAEVEYNAELSKKDQEITSLQKQNDNLTDQLGQLQTDINDVEANAEEAADGSTYENLLVAATLYFDGSSNNQLDSVAIAEAISKVDSSKLEDTNAVNLYNRINDEVSLVASGELYTEGHGEYSNGNYEAALEPLLKSYKYNKDNVDAIYFIGRTYQRMEDYDKAKEYYNILTEDYPATNRAREATTRLGEIE